MKYQELPPRIQEYLGSHYTTLKTLRLASRYRLPKTKIPDYATALGQVFLQEITPDQLPTKLTENLKIQQGDAFLLAADSAEQHFMPYEDFIGSTQPLIAQWRAWGRELGSRKPADKASPEIERMVSSAGQLRGKGMEFRIPSKRSPVQMRPTQTSASRKATVGTKVLERRQQEQESEQQTEQTQVSPEARQRFLTQVRGLSIDALRQGGQSGDARLEQVAQKISQVLEGAPAERTAISQALRNSPLFALYQQLGQEAIRTQQPIDVVIYQRYQQNQPYLMQEEFNAVANLIKQVG